MKFSTVTIKGITDSTLSFSKNGITIRGNSNNLALYPNSIIRGHIVKTQEAEDELLWFQNKKYIVIVDEAKSVEVKKQEEISEKTQEFIKIEEEINKVVSSNVVDIQNGSPENSKETSLIETQKIEIKKEEELPIVKAIRKSVKRLSSSKNNQNISSKTSASIKSDLATPPATTAYDIENNEKLIEQSLEAAKVIEAEEAAAKRDDDPVFIENQTENDMGGEATVSIGNQKTKTVKMANNLTYLSKDAEKSDPFIDPNPLPKRNNVEENPQEIIIPSTNNENSDDDAADAFLEV